MIDSILYLSLAGLIALQLKGAFSFVFMMGCCNVKKCVGIVN